MRAPSCWREVNQESRNAGMNAEKCIRFSFSRICVSFLLPNSYFLVFPLLAHHPFCTARFCSPRLYRRGFAFAGLALPRRHCSTAGTAMGSEPKRMADRLLRCFLSLVHVAALILGSVGLSIWPDRHGLWRDSRLGRSSNDWLGKATRRTFLHSEPLARASDHRGNWSAHRVRLVAGHALRQQRSWRSALVHHRLRRAALPGSCCRISSVLSDLFHWSASPTRASSPTFSGHRYSADE